MMLSHLFASLDDQAPERPPAADSDFWYESAGAWVGGAGTSRRVTPDSAMRVNVVFACVKVISETVAQLPLITYRRKPNGSRERATDISLYRILHDAPNEQQTSFEFREMMTGHMLLRGNAYAEIVPDRNDAVGALVPLHPDRVTPERLANGRRRYIVTEASGRPRVLLQDEVFHLRGLSLDGLTGVSVIEYARRSIALAEAMATHGANLFQRGAKPSGLLKHPGNLTEKASTRLGRQLDSEHGGVNSGRTLVLEEGMTWEQIGLKSTDLEYIASRQFEIEELCRPFRMQPHMIQHLLRSTNNNIEQQGREFIDYTMMPHFRRWEGAISRDLIIAPQTYYAEFNVDALMRGTTLERFQAYNIGRTIGVYTPNDILERENMNRREDPGGDEYMTPLNMKGSNDDPAMTGTRPPSATPAPSPSGPRRVPGKAARARAELFARDAAGRILRREVNEARRAAVKHAGDAVAWGRWISDFAAEHAGQVAAVLHVPIADAEAYAAAQADRLLAGGAAALETWEADNLERVTALALGRNA